MKRAIPIAAAFLVLALLAGCGNQAAVTAGNTTEEITASAAATEETTPETEPETTADEPEKATEATLPAETTTKAATTAKPESQAVTTAKPTTVTTTTTTTKATTTEKPTTTTRPAYGLTGHDKDFFDMFKDYIKVFKDPASIRIIEVHYVVTRVYAYSNDPFYVVLVTAKNSFGATSQSYYYVSSQKGIEDEADLTSIDQAAVRSYINDPSKTHYTYDIKALNAALQEYLEEKGYL